MNVSNGSSVFSFKSNTGNQVSFLVEKEKDDWLFEHGFSYKIGNNELNLHCIITREDFSPMVKGVFPILYKNNDVKLTFIIGEQKLGIFCLNNNLMNLNMCVNRNFLSAHGSIKPKVKGMDMNLFAKIKINNGRLNDLNSGLTGKFRNIEFGYLNSLKTKTNSCKLGLNFEKLGNINNIKLAFENTINTGISFDINDFSFCFNLKEFSSLFSSCCYSSDNYIITTSLQFDKHSKFPHFDISLLTINSD